MFNLCLYLIPDMSDFIDRLSLWVIHLPVLRLYEGGGAYLLKKASAIWLLPELCVQTKRIFLWLPLFSDAIFLSMILE